MKKLLTTTAIATAALIAPAHAQLEVTVGGSVGFQAGWFDNDVATSSDRDFQSEANLIINAQGTADNGLEYGAEVVLDSSTSDTANADETFVFVGGTWGRVILGDEDGASELGIVAPTVGIGQINGSADDFITPADRGHVLNDRGDANFKPFDSGDATKVTYYTPVFSGFQAGVSYTPEVTTGAAGEAVQLTNTGHMSDGIEGALRYTGEFQGVGVSLAGQWNHIGNDDGSEQSGSTWGLGGQLAYKGFKVGGGYTDNNDVTAAAGDSDVTSWNVGATYESGPWGVGISYLDIDLGTDSDTFAFLGTDGNGGDYSEISLGGTYTVAPGLTTGVDVSFYDRDRVTGADTDGTVVIGEVKAAF